MMSSDFHWRCQPKAEASVIRLLDMALQKSRTLQELESAMRRETSTELLSWVDYLGAPSTPALSAELAESGFVVDEETSDLRAFFHPGADLARIVLYNSAHAGMEVAIGVESIADFFLVRGMTADIQGTPLSHFRRAPLTAEHGVQLWIVERRGGLTLEPEVADDDYAARVMRAYERWKMRPRVVSSEEKESEAIREAQAIAEALVESVGRGMAAHIVLDVERAYWQARNTAGQIQKSRQDRLGLGWANHDHHTFRSSRRHFAALVRLFEALGFAPRERFYAGSDAGWGAQIMESREAGITLFCDVDLAPDEVDIDFAHRGLHEVDHLGTVGLWCALHGESILQAGMHHLEAQFSFDLLRDHLKARGVDMMSPFSDLPHLRQAFTAGEQWPVDPARIERLLRKKLITSAQADHFASHGAIGSHLENLQRKEGFKGFNQKGVNNIIRRTDPRLSQD